MKILFILFLVMVLVEFGFSILVCTKTFDDIDLCPTICLCMGSIALFYPLIISIRTVSEVVNRYEYDFPENYNLCIQEDQRLDPSN